MKIIERAAAAAALVLFLVAAVSVLSAGSRQEASATEIRPVESPQPREISLEESLVNINTADADELCTLSGIGPALARRIIDYREEHGPFTDIADIIDVKGIGITTFEKFKDHITV